MVPDWLFADIERYLLLNTNENNPYHAPSIVRKMVIDWYLPRFDEDMAFVAMGELL